MTLQIRLLREADCPAVKCLIRRVWTEHFGGHSDTLVREYMNQAEVLSDIGSDIYESPSGIFLVAAQGDRIIGCGAICTFNETACEVRRMYVLPEGRRQGVARRILSALLLFAVNSGFSEARLTSNKALLASHRLYESAGFRLAPSWDREAEAYAYFYARPLSNGE